MVPLSNDKVYSKHFGFDYYRRLSLGVDKCAEHAAEEECERDPKMKYLGLPQVILDEYDVAATPPPSLDDNIDFMRFLNLCVWKGKRCINKELSALQTKDKDEEMEEIVSGNAALQCVIRDNPEGVLNMIQNCGMFCSYGLHFEDYCDKNFSLFHCLGLMIQYMTDYRAYATLFVGVWVSCLPKTYIWCLRAGLVLVLAGFCSLVLCLWKLISEIVHRICSYFVCLQTHKPSLRKNTWKKRMMTKQSPKPVIKIKLENLLPFASKSRRPQYEELISTHSSPSVERTTFHRLYETIIPKRLRKLVQRMGKIFARKKN